MLAVRKFETEGLDPPPFVCDLADHCLGVLHFWAYVPLVPPLLWPGKRGREKIVLAPIQWR